MPAGDIANILGRLSRRPYITQEVIFGAGEPIQPSEYTGNGDVQEWVNFLSRILVSFTKYFAVRFRYTTTIRDAFLGGGISSLQNLDNRGWVSGSGANIFVANHDTERVRFPLLLPPMLRRLILN